MKQASQNKGIEKIVEQDNDKQFSIVKRNMQTFTYNTITIS